MANTPEPNLKKILFLSYYWPPDKGAGVQRAFQFCKYLPEFGYQPIILTANRSAADVHIADYLLRPADWFASSGDSNKPSAPSFIKTCKKQLLNFVWMNAFIPDSRIGWKRSAVKLGSELIESEQPDLLFSTAPPYTTLLVARELKKRHGLPWVVDFRDPWVENHAYNRSFRFSAVKNINRRMEASVLQTCDAITCATPKQQELLSRKIPGKPIFTITNGYDPEQWPHGTKLTRAPTFNISHFGTMYGDGFPMEILDVLQQFVHAHPDHARNTRFRFTNTIASNVLAAIHEKLPAENIDLLPPVPHGEVIQLMQEQQVLLLITNSGEMHQHSLPSKVFEYRASGNPILGIGPENHDMKAFIPETPNTIYLPKDHKDKLVKFLVSQYQAWVSDDLPDKVQDVKELNRKALTQSLGDTFTKTLST